MRRKIPHRLFAKIVSVHLLAVAAGFGVVAMLALISGPDVARAEDVGEIIVPVPHTARKWRIALPDFRVESTDPRGTALSRALPEILARDLTMCGLFDVVPRDKYLADPQKEDWKGPEIDFPTWKQTGAEHLVKGLIQSSEGKVTLEIRLFEVPRAVMTVGMSYSSPSAEQDRPMIHDFANRILESLTGERGVFDTKILYTAHKDPTNANRGELWTCGLDGADSRKITSWRVLSLYPALSPDGRRLAYTSYEGGAQAIWALDVVSGASRQLTHWGGTNTGPGWSPDGTKIAFAHADKKDGEGGSEIYLMKADGSGVTRLTTCAADDLSASWSPSGTKIAFVSKRLGKPHIFVMDADGSEPTRVTTSGEENQVPRWSPKGDRIAFCSRRMGEGFRIWVMKPDGSEQTRITFGPGSDEDPSWSPDGRMIAFGRANGDDKRIFVVPVTGDPLTAITDGSGKEQGPAWSPRVER